MPASTTFCDVGGGIGSVSIKMAKAHPHIKITLQDVPSVIERARSASIPQLFSCLFTGLTAFIFTVLGEGVSASHQ